MGKHLSVTELNKRDFVCGVRTLRFLDANFELDEEFLYSLPVEIVSLKRENEALKKEIKELKEKLDILINQTEVNFKAFDDRLEQMIKDSIFVSDQQKNKTDIVELNLDYGR